MEKRGPMFNEYRGENEYYVLRNGVLRVYTEKTKIHNRSLKEIVHLSHNAEINLLQDGILEVRAFSPYLWDYLLTPDTEEDAEMWYDAFQNCLRKERQKQNQRIALMCEGTTIFKYNYSNSKRTRRTFWLSPDCAELRWAKQKGRSYSKVALSDCLGIIYGPLTTTFSRAPALQDEDWVCFSLLFLGRTLDVACVGENQVRTWFLGLQTIIASKGSTPVLSEGQFLVRKAQLKITKEAHDHQMTMRAHIVRKVREIADSKDWTVPTRNAEDSDSDAETAETGPEDKKDGNPRKLDELLLEILNEEEKQQQSTAKAAAKVGKGSTIVTGKGTLASKASDKKGASTPVDKKKEKDSKTVPAVASQTAEMEKLIAENKELKEIGRELLKEKTRADQIAEDREALSRHCKGLEETIKNLKREGAAGTGIKDGDPDASLELKVLQEKNTEMEMELERLSQLNELSLRQKERIDQLIKAEQAAQKEHEEKKQQLAVLNQQLNQQQVQSESASEQYSALLAQFERSEAQRQSMEKRVAELEHDLESKLKLDQKAGQASSANAQAILIQTQEVLKKEQERNRDLEQNLLQAQDQLREATRAFEKSEKDKATLMATLQKNEGKTKKIRNANKFLLLGFKHAWQVIQQLKSTIASIKEEALQQKRSMTDVWPHLEAALQKQSDFANMYADKYNKVMEERKKLHNMVQQLQGNIRVFCRVRPLAADERAHEPNKQTTINVPDTNKIIVYNDYDTRKKMFEFDRVFSPGDDQTVVYGEVRSLITSVLDGYNVCIFAYGQTGSGKTYTMEGPPQNRGVNFRALQELFELKRTRSSDFDISIMVSVLEIYNEQIRDLLEPSNKRLDVRGAGGRDEEDRVGSRGGGGGGSLVPGLTEIKVTSFEQVTQAMSTASTVRATSATDMNDTSSRSHCLLSIRVHNRSLVNGVVFTGRLHLIDLAGSENVSRSGVTGQAMTEAKHINKSLAALGDVIQALCAKKDHIPYRNSKLTMLLKDSLGGDSKTLMVVQVSPSQSDVTETTNSLNFAARARNVELGVAKRHARLEV
eukprot:GILK01006532.1.p1 GENE.GILK01006532.1~~GILK01006532.1.p1  ORF type:complete len:1069 (+),score=245.18 GILK01006532.1:59-3208(+)